MRALRILAQYHTLADRIALFIGIANSADVKLETRGQSIILAKCASCHAIGKTGRSPVAKAPAFCNVHRRYNAAHLAESVSEGISTDHSAMPTFVFQPPEIDAILAYLKSLEKGVHRKMK